LQSLFPLHAIDFRAKTPGPLLMGSPFAPKFFLDEDFGLFPKRP
jgi:hypothetical protein